ncbi:MAG TPA: CHAT domain-containing protein [Kofleriaceae bacterium]|nr:CHAT domain-containing protein [Kofleriaceae bacterium]
MKPPKLVIRIDRGRIKAEANDVSDDDGTPANATTYERDLTSEPLSKATIDAFVSWVEEETPRLREAGDFSLFGWHLWEFLFCGEIAEAFAMQMGIARSTRTPMRLELWIDPAESPAIARVPWEFLYCPPRGGVRDGFFLATHTALTFSRTFAAPSAGRDVRITEPPRILIITSCPVGFERVVWRPAVEGITGAIAGRLAGARAGDAQVAPTVRVVHDPKDAAALCDALSWRPHVVQFIGHGHQDGNLGRLAMLADDPVWVSGKQLVNLMDTAAPGHRPRLVVLHACDGARIARAGGLSPKLGFGAVAPTLLAEDIPAVVAMQYEIDQASAIDFSVKLYADLLANRPIHQAVQLARLNLLSLHSNAPRAFGTPVLYASGGDGVLFAAAAPQSVSRAPSVSRPASPQDAAPRADAAKPAAAAESAPFTAAGMEPRGGGG